MNLHLPYRFWRRLMWLPEPVYFWLYYRVNDDDGWRPLGYRGRSE